MEGEREGMSEYRRKGGRASSQGPIPSDLDSS